MKDEYIIINKSVLEKRIEEIIVEQKNIIKKLKELYDSLKGSNKYFYYKDNLSRHFTILTNEKRFIEKTLSQSTPLIPEIEKAFDAGSDSPKIVGSYPAFPRTYAQENDRINYINNLKLDI